MNLGEKFSVFPRVVASCESFSEKLAVSPLRGASYRKRSVFVSHPPIPGLAGQSPGGTTFWAPLARLLYVRLAFFVVVVEGGTLEWALAAAAAGTLEIWTAESVSDSECRPSVCLMGSILPDAL